MTLVASTGGQVEVASAGSGPEPRHHPNAILVLPDEFAIDITGRRPGTWTP